MIETNTPQTQSWIRHLDDSGSDELTGASVTCVSNWIDRVREAAKRDKNARFTALFHRLTPEVLKRNFEAINPKACEGADGVKRWMFEEDLDNNINGLCQRLHRWLMESFS
ncbi:MAG: hypothetical protein LBS60_05185 [Deltaproteobacteria bacterium]|nr:hypothetical protein [Deltaproteobacteria bacterium]